ncbi:trehalase family glycosidase [Paenibacillus filicis]|uniref:Trehalase family glycosidase n=1 Tax=Paenibacillus filicis TaxID=669464 RepID=A0ABU9DIA7_9BACL
MEQLRGTHDLPQLPAWGPYTKTYIGISHIADAKRGLRFDLSLFPGFYRRKVDVPNTMWESGYHPWESSPDLSWYTHRHELEWKDRVYADISYAELPGTRTGEARLLRCELANRTEAEQNVVLHAMASLHFPQVSGHGDRLETVRPELPDGALWTDALDYAFFSFGSPRPSDNLVYDGFSRGERRGQGLVGGSALGFGGEAGDRASYSFELAHPMKQAALLLRWRLQAGQRLRLQVTGAAENVVELVGTGDVSVTTVAAGALQAGRHELVLTAVEAVDSGTACGHASAAGPGYAELDGFAVAELDGFAIAELDAADEVRFVPEPSNAIPELSAGPVPNSLLIKYEGIDHYYGLLWAFDDYEVREFHCDELDRFLRHNVHHHTSAVFKGTGDGHFTNVYLRPIPLAPHTSKIIHGMVCSGAKEDVERQLAEFRSDADHCEAIFSAVKRKSEARAKAFNPSGEPYRFGQQLMEATLATNVVYPVYTRRSYIRHNTPGRWWDSLYTWDSGFIGIGLAELDIERAIECLNAYMTEPGDTHAAFIHHGSMVPVQHYLFLEIWNKTQSRQLLDYFYPKLKQYYRFYAGKLGSSTTGTLSSGLLKTWDYFYNSGGWDDYAPQVEVHRSSLTGIAAPVSNTANAIRIAKILTMAATALGGLEEDTAEYERDIARFSKAIQAHAWDEESGYFGYVLHDGEGRPERLLRHESGQNYNMGLDGAYPLVAGICSPEQESRLIGHLTDGSRLWSPIGLTAIDQSAAYYKKDGYWNGAVWMPHQWFYWKMLLGLGYGEAARRIADTALELWQNETGESYNCYEHFIVQSGRGAGWHHFGGLSAPVLSWFAAYHRPGTLTAGYDVWLEHVRFSADHAELSADLRYFGSPERSHTVLACMREGLAYRALWNGEPVAAATAGGLLDIQLPGDSAGTLTICPV